MALRGLTNLENKVALAIEAALPFATSPKTGWTEVPSERRAICAKAAKDAVLIVRQWDDADYRRPNKKRQSGR